jgi:hypothetical protein
MVYGMDMQVLVLARMSMQDTEMQVQVLARMAMQVCNAEMQVLARMAMQVSYILLCYCVLIGFGFLDNGKQELVCTKVCAVKMRCGGLLVPGKPQ